MHSTAFDKNSHKYEECDAHGDAPVPVLDCQLLECLQRLVAQEEVLETNEWAVGVDCTTFQKDVTVALEVVARRTRS